MMHSANKAVTQKGFPVENLMVNKSTVHSRHLVRLYSNFLSRASFGYDFYFLQGTAPPSVRLYRD